jgi:hypothetical protein
MATSKTSNVAAITTVTAKAINAEYRKAKSSAKAELDHGKFIPWVEAECEFQPRAAQMMMRSYRKAQSTAYLTEAAAAEICRDTWNPSRGLVWADPRMEDESYHAALDRLISETTPSGGIALVPDPDQPGVNPEDATWFCGRTPSTNPAWMRGLIAHEGVGRDYVIEAVEKAKDGERLGAKQKRIVKLMLDEIDQPSEYITDSMFAEIDLEESTEEPPESDYAIASARLEELRQALLVMIDLFNKIPQFKNRATTVRKWLKELDSL